MYFTYSSAHNYVRTFTQVATLNDSRKLTADYKRSFLQSVQAITAIRGIQTISRIFQEIVKGLDNNYFPVLHQRTVDETIKVSATMSHLWTIFRILIDDAGIDSKVLGGWFLTTKITDTANAVGSVFRGLIIFIRLVTKVLIRDFLLRRFLIAREELVLKSCVTREITLDSRIS